MPMSFGYTKSPPRLSRPHPGGSRNARPFYEYNVICVRRAKPDSIYCDAHHELVMPKQAKVETENSAVSKSGIAFPSKEECRVGRARVRRVIDRLPDTEETK